jgi:hypothetical protein
MIRPSRNGSQLKYPKGNNLTAAINCAPQNPGLAKSGVLKNTKVATSTAHTRAYIDAEDYREKANGVVAELDI